MLLSEPDLDAETEAMMLSEPIPRAPSFTKHKGSTPVPTRQILCLLALAVAEPIHATQIQPYLPQLIEEIGITGGDMGKVGYYSGLIDTTFFFTEAIFVLQWARISDQIGRRPVLLMGVTGISISATCFGLSNTFQGLLFSRALAGVLNANFAVLRGAMAEILDPSNFARTIAWLPIMWSAGATVGPLVGGSLSHPYERLPHLFGDNKLWKRHPYLLPCLFSATVSASAFVLAFFFLKETLHSRREPSIHDGYGEYQLIESRASSSVSNPPPIQSTPVLGGPRPTLRSLITPPLMIILLNYSIFSLLEVSLTAVLPLYLAAPFEFGGLGFSPSQIGVCLAVLGVFNGTTQVMYFASIHAVWGSKKMLRAGMLAYAAIFALFPLVSWLAKKGSVGVGVWIILMLQAGMFPTASMVSSCITILLTSATPPPALGAANGLAQTTASFLRALGPAGVTSLLALSVDKNLAGGSFVFYIASAISLLGFATGGLIMGDGLDGDRYD
ncbi:MFS general substrate transporter [Ramaria rubella]|nr:MFS general substrate transporter [Ramaria rubella]